jgi:ATP-binding cassette subfamily F protein 3
MAFVQLSGISLAFGEREILKDVTLNLAAGSRCALTGANGSGKTTLMRILAGEVRADSGNVIKQKDTKVSYLPQSGIVHRGSTLLDEAERAFDPIISYIRESEGIGKKLENATEDDPETVKLLETLHHHQETVENSGYYSRAERIDRVLAGLGFVPADHGRMTEEFSGGWQMRIALAKVLLETPDILLLDEPTNYLDIEARTWLETHLSDFRGGVLVVSHDRYFLDVTVKEVAEIFAGRLTRYPGNYTAYEKRREQELISLSAAYRDQQEEIARQEEFIRRFRYNASKAAMVQSRIKQLQKTVLIEIPESMKRIHFTFPDPPHSGRTILHARDLSKSYGAARVFQNLDFDLERGEKLVVAGRNGAGKSTLLRILAGEDKNHTGKIEYGAGAVVNYFAQEQNETLDASHSVIEEIEGICPTALFPKIRTMLGAFLFRGDDIYKSVAVLSGGERNRLALLKMLLFPANLLVLDEPTNHLDINSKDVLLDALKVFEGTVVFVSHDRYFIEGLATKVLELRAGLPPRFFPGDYQYYLFRTEKEAGEGGAAPVPSGMAVISPAAASDPSEERGKAKRNQSILRKLERREGELLGRIEVLETKHRDLLHRLALPEVYSDGAQVKAVKKAIEENEGEQKKLHDEWEALSAEMADLPR